MVARMSMTEMNMTELPLAEDLFARLAASVRAGIPPNTAIVGIHTGGVWVAERLAAALNYAGPVGVLDISFYRDDFSRIGLHPQVKPSRLPFDIEHRDILLVDDVLFTGRTVRAAMNSLYDYGRPATIRLAVLVDRGGHELPIRPDFVGATLDVPASRNLVVSRDNDGGDHLHLTFAD
jgi:pyrimidine operon attenuation protein/uracil phosphoribosyltransferase